MIKAIPFDFPYDGRLVPQHTALLVIDLQEDFLSPAGYFARKGYDPSPLRAILPTVNRLIAAARAAGVTIIHTRQGYRADMADMTPYEKWRRKRAGLDGTDVLLRSGPGFQICAEIDVAPQDVIIDKTCNSAFTYTDLEMVLRARGITHLLFTGCTTDVCVHTTLREACDRNFQCLTISDACASGDQYAHEAALHMVTVEDGIFGAGGLANRHCGSAAARGRRALKVIWGCHRNFSAPPFRLRFRLRLEDRNRCESRDGLRPQDKRSRAMSTTVTLINVFTAKPGKQQELARTLAEGTRNFFSKQPGSLSSSVVVGGDGSKVANISQWRSAEDIAAFRSDPRFADYMKSIIELAAGESMMGHTIYSHTGGVEHQEDA